jgi:hypothetical protein
VDNVDNVDNVFLGCPTCPQVMHRLWITNPRGYKLCTGFGLIEDLKLWITSTCGVDNFCQGVSVQNAENGLKRVLMRLPFVDNVDMWTIVFKSLAPILPVF